MSSSFFSSLSLFFQHLLSRFGHTLPDKGANLAKELDLIKQRMIKLKGYIPNQKEILEYLNKPEDIEGDEEERVRRGKGGERGKGNKRGKGGRRERERGRRERNKRGEEIMKKE